MAARKKTNVGFYGGEQSALEKLVTRLTAMHPELQAVYSYSPPFRLLSEQEAAQIRQEIVQSGVQILFVGLGCPAQAKWIDAERGCIPAVMIGVGAGFLFPCWL